MTPEQKKKIWDYANANITIFLLSVLALSIIPFQYSSCQAEKQRKETIRRLDFELINRMSQWLNASVDPKVDELYRSRFPEYADILLRVPSQDPPVPLYGVYAEYMNRPLVSLVAEYQALSESSTDVKTIQSLIISVNSARVQRPSSDATTPLPLGDAAKVFLKSSGLIRWSGRLPSSPVITGIVQR